MGVEPSSRDTPPPISHFTSELTITAPVVSLLLTCPPYVLCVITTCLNAWHADRKGERYLHIVPPLCVAMAAFILRAAALAFVNAVSNCSSIHASYLYPARDGPQYKAALDRGEFVKGAINAAPGAAAAAHGFRFKA
ncbi:pantothenate transporter liz1 [Colletotrichum graminicola]|nr:pantothenate transporter liz1 [Colletotrichum graminicola]